LSVDVRLGASRGPNREPSSTDFIVIDLPTIVAEFAERFDAMPHAYPGRSDYRALVASGTLVATCVVIG
jgi:hypothetical protein